VFEVEGVRIALFICFDLRFPELFRAVAPSIDCIIVIASWPSARQSHWDTLLRARSIESQAYVIGVNRVGRAGDGDYAGGSAAYGPWGEALQGAGDPVIVTIDPASVASARRKFPFVLSLREVISDQ
jgi:predicted amidohydrolase